MRRLVVGGAACVLACALACAAHGASAQVLLSGAWTDTLMTGEPDEAVEVVNTGAFDAELAGFTLRDDDGASLTLPSLVLAPGERAWIARDAAAFATTFGAPPAIESAGADALVPDGSGTWPLLANAGDELRLADASGAVLDALVYGAATPTGPWWSGPGADAGFDPGFGSGLLITRDRVEGDTACVADTDTAADWDDLRLERPGATHLLPFGVDAPGRITAAVGPDATLPLLSGVIAGATTSLRVAIYELESVPVRDLLLAALSRGVSVRVLLEGEPVGGVSDQERSIASSLAAAGADVRWLRAEPGRSKRHPFLHAKLVVADDAVAHVSTENAGFAGAPADPTFGNRGWSLRHDDARVAAWLAALFDDMADPRYGDVAPFDEAADAPAPGFVPDDGVPSDWSHPTTAPLSADDATRVEVVVSPDHASLRAFGVLGLLARATTSLRVEQLSLPLHWGAGGDPPDLHPSALLGAIVDAARRGVSVRVVLDASWYSVEPSDPRDNDDTCDYLTQLAAAESLDMECRLLDPDWANATVVHVKGFVVDDRVVHVGSMNGTSNSYCLNREVALQAGSATLARFFALQFDRDLAVARVGARVPAETQGLRVARSGADLAMTWDAPPTGSPPVRGWRVHASADAASEAAFAVAADTTARGVALAPAPRLQFYLVAAYAAGPGGIIEGPSGAYDGYLDR